MNKTIENVMVVVLFVLAFVGFNTIILIVSGYSFIKDIPTQYSNMPLTITGEKRAQEREDKCTNYFGTSTPSDSYYDVSSDTCYAIKLPKVLLK